MAALLTFTLLVLLLLVDPIGQYAQSETVRLVVSRVDLFDHLNDFARGVVDTRHVVFHLSMVTFCLTVAVKALDRRRFP